MSQTILEYATLDEIVQELAERSEGVLITIFGYPARGEKGGEWFTAKALVGSEQSHEVTSIMVNAGVEWMSKYTPSDVRDVVEEGNSDDQ